MTPMKMAHTIDVGDKDEEMEADKSPFDLSMTWMSRSVRCHQTDPGGRQQRRDQAQPHAT